MCLGQRRGVPALAGAHDRHEKGFMPRPRGFFLQRENMRLIGKASTNRCASCPGSDAGNQAVVSGTGAVQPRWEGVLRPWLPGCRRQTVETLLVDACGRPMTVTISLPMLMGRQAGGSYAGERIRVRCG